MPVRKQPTPAVIAPEVTGASLEGIYTAPFAGAPMEQQGTVVLAPGVGIVGDRYALGTGTWSDQRYPDQELTLFEAEIAEAIGIEPYQTRRNLVTRGITLSGLVGVRFRIGAALMVGVRQCDPCRYIADLNGDRRLTKELGGWSGGLRARIVEGGIVRLGDAIEIVGLEEE